MPSLKEGELQNFVLGPPPPACLPHDAIHTHGFQSCLSADGDVQMYPWPSISPEPHSGTSNCLLSVSICMSHGHCRCCLLTMGPLIFTIKPVLHPHLHLFQLSKSTQLPRNLGAALDSSSFFTLDIQPVRKSQLFCFQNITCLHLSCHHLAHTINTSCQDHCTNLPRLHSPSCNLFSTQQLQ